MERYFYLLTLDICGIKNIANPIHLDFYKKTINKDFNPEKYKIKAIYGENGSGKTAIITAVKLLRTLILNKSYLADNETQKSLVEIINKRTRKGYIACEVYVDIEDYKQILYYSIAFAIKEDGRVYITEEKLKQKNGNYSKNAYIPVFETKDGVLIRFSNDNAFDFVKQKTMNLLDKQSLSACLFAMKDFMEFVRVKEVFLTIFVLQLFAGSVFVCIDRADIHTNPPFSTEKAWIGEDAPDMLEREMRKQMQWEMLQGAERNVLVPKVFYDIYKERITRLKMFIQIFKPELVDIEIEKKDYNQFYQCNFKMVYEDYTLDREFESRGIKKLMGLFDYLDGANNGYIIFIDELDSNINDVYLDKIIEFFKLYGNGQLCFTSHNLSPMSVLKGNKNAITFISSMNTVHTWTNSGNLSPENAYKNGFIEDSPFNVDASDFLGILGGDED